MTVLDQSKLPILTEQHWILRIYQPDLFPEAIRDSKKKKKKKKFVPGDLQYHKAIQAPSSRKVNSSI